MNEEGVAPSPQPSGVMPSALVVGISSTISGGPLVLEGVPTEIPLEEMPKHWHKKPGPKYYLAILCPGQSLANTTDTQCWCGYKMTD